MTGGITIDKVESHDGCVRYEIWVTDGAEMKLLAVIPSEQALPRLKTLSYKPL